MPKDLDIIELLHDVYQDGDEFYRENGTLIISYTKKFGQRICRGDFDREGAKLARAMFAYDFPSLAKVNPPK